MVDSVVSAQLRSLSVLSPKSFDNLRTQPTPWIPPIQPSNNDAIFCHICSEYITPLRARQHKMSHKALKLLNIKHVKKLKSVNHLAERRQHRLTAAIDSMQNGYTLSRTISEYNIAYEILKNYCFGDEHFLPKVHKIRNHVQSTSDLEDSFVCGATLSTIWNQEFSQSEMFSNFKFTTPFENNEAGLSIFTTPVEGLGAADFVLNSLSEKLVAALLKTGFFDSVDNEEDAEYLNFARSFMSGMLSTCVNNFDSNVTKAEKPKHLNLSEEKLTNIYVRTAFETTYKQLDRELSYGQDEQSRVRWSGSSTTSILYTFDPFTQQAYIHPANIGNSHAVLVSDVGAKIITQEHTVFNTAERKRILAWGGAIQGSKEKPAVLGQTSYTRMIGMHGNRTLKRLLPSKPYTNSIKVNLPTVEESEGNCHVGVIVADAGFWSVVTYDEVAVITHSILGFKKRQFEQEAAMATADGTQLASRVSTGLYRRRFGNLLDEPDDEAAAMEAQDTFLTLVQAEHTSAVISVRQNTEACLAVSDGLAQAAIMAGSQTNVSVSFTLFRRWYVANLLYGDLCPPPPPEEPPTPPPEPETRQPTLLREETIHESVEDGYSPSLAPDFLESVDIDL